MGFRKGIVLELASLAGLALGIWGSMKFSGLTAKYLSEWLDASKSLISISSFLLTFVLIVIGVYLLAKLIDKSLKMVAMGFLIRIGGAIFGMLKYALILIVLFYLFEVINHKWDFVAASDYQDSYGYKTLSLIKEPIYNWLDQLDLTVESKVIDKAL